MNLLRLVKLVLLALRCGFAEHEKLIGCDLAQEAILHCKVKLRRVISLDDCGGIRDRIDIESAKQNGQALAAAFGAARAGDEILIPYGARYYMIPKCEIWGPIAENISLRISGSISALDEIEAWPANGSKYISLLSIHYANGLQVNGGGMIEGNGHRWWWKFLFPPGLNTKRPMLIDFSHVQNLVIENLAFFNSPRFHIHVTEANTARISNLVILVDWQHQQHITRIARNTQIWQQQSTSSWLKKARAWLQIAFITNPFPMFPFNTDGVDVAGSDILVENLFVENWDDVVAIKPSKRIFSQSTELGPSAAKRAQAYSDWHWCTRNVIVRNVTSLFGGGLSVGDVVAGKQQECVRGASFEQITLYRPFKGIYVKTSGHCSTFIEDCSALIADIKYRDIRIHGKSIPHWWEHFVRTQRHRGGILPLTRQTEIQSATRWPLAETLLRISTRNAPAQAPTWSCRTHWLLGRLPCFAWPLYIGPQQQSEPYGSNNPGLWPNSKTGVALLNLTVTRFKATGGDWPESAAAIRCDPNRPCSGLVFKDIHIKAKAFGQRRAWVCDYKRVAFGEFSNVSPHPRKCIAPVVDSNKSFSSLLNQSFSLSHTGHTSAAKRRGQIIKFLFILFLILFLILFCACCCFSSGVFYVAYAGKHHDFSNCLSVRLCLPDIVLFAIFAARARCIRYYNIANRITGCASNFFFNTLWSKIKLLFTCLCCFTEEAVPLLRLNRSTASSSDRRPRLLPRLLHRHRFRGYQVIVPTRADEKEDTRLAYATVCPCDNKSILPR